MILFKRIILHQPINQSINQSIN